MSSDEGRIMTKRVPVSEKTHLRVRDFARGLDTTMDDALNFLIDLASKSGDAFKDGRALRVKLAEMRTATATDEKEDSDS